MIQGRLVHKGRRVSAVLMQVYAELFEPCHCRLSCNRQSCQHLVLTSQCCDAQVDAGYVAGRNGTRGRVPQCDRLDRRLRCDRGSRSSGGRIEDCGSPSAVRDDPLLEEFKANRLRRLEMRVCMEALPDEACSTCYHS